MGCVCVWLRVYTFARLSRSMCLCYLQRWRERPIYSRYFTLSHTHSFYNTRSWKFIRTLHLGPSLFNFLPSLSLSLSLILHIALSLSFCHRKAVSYSSCRRVKIFLRRVFKIVQKPTWMKRRQCYESKRRRSRWKSEEWRTEKGAS